MHIKGFQLQEIHESFYQNWNDKYIIQLSEKFKPVANNKKFGYKSKK